MLEEDEDLSKYYDYEFGMENMLRRRRYGDYWAAETLFGGVKLSSCCEIRFMVFGKEKR